MTRPETPPRPGTHRFWAEALPHPLPHLSLPEDKRRPPVLTAQSGVFQHRFAPALSPAISRLCTLERLSAESIYTTAIGLVLRRSLMRDTVILGIPVSPAPDRTPRAHLPIELSFDEGLPALDSLRAVETQIDQTAHHADIPFDQLIELTGQLPHPAHHPLFQVAVDYDTAPPARVSQQPGGHAPLDLSIRIGRTRTEITFAQDLYEPDSIARLARRVETVINQICNSPASTLRSMSIIPQSELAELAALYDAPIAPNAFASIPEMIADTVRQHPNAPAIRDHDQTLSYRQLDTLSDRAAALLVTQGVTHGSKIGVHLSRTPELVAWLLGILKIGAIYVPIDTSYPADRVQTLLADAPCAFCLVQAGCAPVLPDPCKAIAVGRTTLLSTPDTPAHDARPPASEDTAYLIYTSGSTGRPKGIRINHGSVVNLLEWTRNTFSKDDLRCVAATTSLNFDMSIFEIFGTLGAGGMLLMLEDALDIIDSPLQHQITLIDTVPSAMSALLPLAPDLLSCRVVNLGGEALPRALCDQIHAALPGIRLFNMYGPSETTTFSTFALVPANSSAVPNIGNPLRNTQLLILNDDGSLTPKGMIGELFIGGSGVTQGYLNRSELTGQKYVSCAALGAKGQFFRTGDLVSWGHDGELRYHGRMDHQVKIRGHRVELGEIDAVLTAAPGVEKAVTIGTRSDSHHDMMLVAYVTGTALPADLKTHLAQRLPGFMVPHHIVVLDALPSNANGKLDRAALPDPTLAHRATATPHPTPSGVVAARSNAVSHHRQHASVQG
nr:amino acid adenylation domain-containing protein [Puniceibacterium sediminis]